ncbi:hypothetical protein NicSoilE8_41460 (plasmid) [Arthrobacter sp. NicSoilE8]|nr:hypothetical protein NicSoilE8_41460 [Arthrobacter sp. NicSoilE8]
MNYWYAMQGDNYHSAMQQKSLWTCPRGNDRPLKETRSIIFEMQVGDIVFHHAKGYLRAVSTVVESYQESERPEGYKRRPDEGDAGWLVRVEPIKRGLALPYTKLAGLTRVGRPGPLNSPTNVYVGFLSRLTEGDGLSLLSHLQITPPVPDSGLLGHSSDYWGDEDTDGLAWSSIRKEQAHLRKHLLQGRPVAPCSLCGSEVPSGLLIAGHIKPRSKCSEQERRDFRAAAMLVCSLGCDVLFEWGYVVVDAGGEIAAGLPAETHSVRTAIARLIGRHCKAHNEHTARNFAAHKELKLASAEADGRRMTV